MRKKNDFFISGYIMPPRTTECFRDLKDSGLTHIYIDYTEKKEIREQALSLCDRFGLKAIVMTCWSRYDNPAYRRVTEGVLQHESFDGINGLDEPMFEDFNSIKEEYEHFSADFSDKTFYVNMVNRGVPTKFVSSISGITHKDLMDRYTEFVKGMKADKTVSMTIYPLMHDDQGVNFLNENHLTSLRDLAESAKSCGAEMYFFVQAMPFRSTHRKPEEADVRFQVNCGLAFGAKGIQYFCYRTPDANWEFSDTQYAMIKIDGEKTDIYDSVKKINQELKSLAGDYLPLEYVNTYSAAGDCGETTNSFQSFHVNEKLPEGLEYFRAEHDCIIGEFMGKTDKAFFIVNYTDPSYDRDNYVEFSLKGKTECEVIIRGKRHRLTACYGRFSVLLAAGDGVLILCTGG